MQKISAAIAFLSFISLGILLMGFFIMDWKVTSVTPYILVSLLLFLQCLSSMSIHSRKSTIVGFITLNVQIVLSALFLFELIEIAISWEWMFLMVILSYAILLQDIVFRFVLDNKKKIIHSISLTFSILIVVLSYLYLFNIFTSILVYILVILSTLLSVYSVLTFKGLNSN